MLELFLQFIRRSAVLFYALLLLNKRQAIHNKFLLRDELPELEKSEGIHNFICC